MLSVLDTMTKPPQQAPRGSQSVFAFQTQKASGESMSWDPEEVHPNDNQDGSPAYNETGGNALRSQSFHTRCKLLFHTL